MGAAPRQSLQISIGDPSTFINYLLPLQQVMSTCTSCQPYANNLEKRLAEVELSLKEHKQKFREMDRKAEALNREERQLNLILYNVQETAEEGDGGVEAFDSLLDKCMPNGRDDVALAWEQTRLGAYRPDQERPLPSRKLLASTVNDTRSTALRCLQWSAIIDLSTSLTTVCCCLVSLVAKPAQEQGQMACEHESSFDQWSDASVAFP